MKIFFLAIVLIFTSSSFAKSQKSAQSNKPVQIIGVLVNSKKLPKDEKAFIQDLSKYRWTVHPKGLQLNEAPKDSVAFDVGLRIGDVVASVNDHQMANADSIFNGIASVRDEQKCQLLVFRDKKFIQFNVSAK